VKGLFTLDEVLNQFDTAPTIKIQPKPAAVKVSGYTEYSAAAVDAATKEGKDVALFFHSKTCGSCAKLDADIVANGASIPSDVAVFKTDRDDNQDLAVKYGVDKYHTVAYM
jgi:proteasome lid subunit RPN8/RPN11